LVFTKISARTGETHHYAAAVDGPHFVMREYAVEENIDAPLSSTNMPQIPNSFLGRSANFNWSITGLQITESPISDPAGSATRSQVDSSRRMLDEVLRLGAPDLVEWSTVQWGNGTFSASLAGNVSAKANGRPVKALPGAITVTNGVVDSLRCVTRVRYEYEPKSSLPRGIPKRISICTAPQWQVDTVYVVQQMVYGQAGELAPLFDPEAYVADPKGSSVIMVNRGHRSALRGTDQLGLVGDGGMRNKRNAAAGRFVLAAVVLALPVALVLLSRSAKRRAGAPQAQR
jgi:hypothetical protein